MLGPGIRWGRLLVSILYLICSYIIYRRMLPILIIVGGTRQRVHIAHEIESVIYVEHVHDGDLASDEFAYDPPQC